MIFVIVFQLSVVDVDVAIATLISDIINAVLIIYFLHHANAPVKITFSNFNFDLKLCCKIFSIGIPAAVQGMMFNLANLVIQIGLNSLGSDIVAASTIGLNAEIFTYYVINGFGQAAVTFNGQNLGAGNLKRCRRATLWCTALGGFFTILISLLFVLLAQSFAALFTTNAHVIQLTMTRIYYVLSFEIFNLIIEIYSGSLCGLGHSLLPAILSAVFICSTRMVWLFTIFPTHHTMEGLISVYPVSWFIADFIILITYVYVIRQHTGFTC